MGFKSTKEYSEQRASIGFGAYLYKVVAAEYGTSAAGKAYLQIDIKLWTMAKEDAGTELKYISWYYENDFGAKQLNEFVTTSGCDSAKLEANASAMVGCAGVVLVGKGQNFKDPSKFYLEPWNGGIGAWYSKEQLNAKEVDAGAKEPEAFNSALSSCVSKPYKMQGSYETVAEVPTGVNAPVTESTPETDSDLPF